MSGSQLGRPWVDHVIIDGVHSGELNALAEKVAKAFDEEEKRPKRVASARESLQLAEQYDALLAEAERKYRLRALQRRRWDDLKAEHPARTDDDGGEIVEADKPTKVNATTFFESVMAESIIASDGDPREAGPRFSDRECDEFIADLSKGDWQELCSVVWVLNERGVGVPKSSMASLLRRRIEESSEQPEPSESPSPASTGGSRIGGPITTTSTET